MRDLGGIPIIPTLASKSFADGVLLSRFFQFGQRASSRSSKKILSRQIVRLQRCETADRPKSARCTESPGLGGHKFPGFIRCEGEDWCEHFAQAGYEAVQRGLGRAAAMKIGGIGVEPVFHHIMVNGR